MAFPIIPTIFVIYILIVLVIGIYAGKGLTGFEDFSVMGRSAVGPLIVATLSGTIIGAGATLGTSGTANTSGITAIITLTVPWGLMLVATAYLGNPLWEIGQETNAQSLGDATGYFYGTPTQVTVGLLGLIMTVPVLGAQMAAIGTVFSTVLLLPYNIGVLVGGLIVVIYSTVAGIRGVIITDWFQVVILLIIIPGIALGLLFTVGMKPVISSVEPQMFNLLGGRTLFNLISFMILIFGSELLAPYYIGRLYAGDKKPGKRGYLAAFTSTTYMISAIGIGLMGVVILPSVTGENIIPEIMRQAVPSVIGGVGLAALFAVIMSSSDSILNGISVILVRDFYNIGRDVTGRGQLLIGRVTTVVIGIAAIIAAVIIPNVLGLLTLGYNYWAPTVLVFVGAMLLTKKQNVTPYTPPVAMIGAAIFLTGWYVVSPAVNINPFLPTLMVNIILLVGYHYLSTSFDIVPSGEA